jgi:hypothetical protein
MSEYKIERWDVILLDNHRVPVIYIKPDLEFVEFIRKNDYNIVAEINHTGTVYDMKKINAIVDQSAYNLNCRPNFFTDTGYYVITLNSSWNGYPKPDKLGTVVFYGLRN